jgi:hypothetical protein
MSQSLIVSNTLMTITEQTKKTKKPILSPSKLNSFHCTTLPFPDSNLCDFVEDFHGDEETRFPLLDAAQLGDGPELLPPAFLRHVGSVDDGINLFYFVDDREARGKLRAPACHPTKFVNKAE